MNMSEYQMLASRTQNGALDPDAQLQHALCGLAAECGEIHGIFQKALQGHEILQSDVAEELGDLLWFCAELADCIAMDLGDVARANIEKLKKRYPEGFEEDRSVHREV